VLEKPHVRHWTGFAPVADQLKAIPPSSHASSNVQPHRKSSGCSKWLTLRPTAEDDYVGVEHLSSRSLDNGSLARPGCSPESHLNERSYRALQDIRVKARVAALPPKASTRARRVLDAPSPNSPTRGQAYLGHRARWRNPSCDAHPQPPPETTRSSSAMARRPRSSKHSPSASPAGTSLQPQGQRVLALDLGALVSGSNFRGEFERAAQAVMEESSGHGELVAFIVKLSHRPGRARRWLPRRQQPDEAGLARANSTLVATTLTNIAPDRK